MKAIVSASVLCVTLGVYSFGRDLVVDPLGAGDYIEIQAAIDAAQDGDTVRVTPGEYLITEPITFRGKAITVRAQEGQPPENTVIRMSDAPSDPEGASVIVFESREGNSSVLVGFTLTGGRKGGIKCDSPSSPRISSCIIKGNSTSWKGGGVYCEGEASPSLDSCTISENSAEAGGGICCGYNTTLTNCAISGNSASYGGGVYCGDLTTLTNCTISGNSASYGGGLWGDRASMDLTNCIVWENVGGSLSGINERTTDVSYSCIEGNEVWPGVGNINVNPLFCGWNATDVYVDSTHPEPGTGHEGSPFQDLVAALRDYSFALRAGSPCIGSGRDGTNMGANLGVSDEPGFGDRLVHLAAGAYNIAGVSLVHNVSVVGEGAGVTVIEGTVLGLRTGALLSHVTITGGREEGIAISSGEGPEIIHCVIRGNSAPLNGSTGGGVYLAGDSFPTFKSCTIWGNWGWGVHCGGGHPTLTNCIVWGNTLGSLSDRTAQVNYSCLEGVEVSEGMENMNLDPLFCGWGVAEVYVDSANPAPGDGRQDNPFQDLAVAFRGYSLALSGGSPCLGRGDDGENMGAALGVCDELGPTESLIRLASGTYNLAGLQPAPAVKIAGAGEDQTVIEGTVHGLRTGWVLSRVTITGGDEGGIVVSRGEAPEINDCTIKGNSAPYAVNGSKGGGVYCAAGSSPTLRNCTIMDNTAHLGAGVYCDRGSSPTFRNCAIVDNSAGMGHGGGLYCSDSSPPLEGCGISRNAAHCGGGVYCAGVSSPSLEDCTITLNRCFTRSVMASCYEPAGGGVYCENEASPVITHCTIAGNIALDTCCDPDHVCPPGCVCGYGGAFWGRSPTLTSCIVWDNTPPGGILSSQRVTYSCGNVGDGEGNLQEDPLFCGPDGDYRLSVASPCLGAGHDGDDMGAHLGGCDLLPFRRGDANTDNTVDIADAVFTLSYLFGGGVTPTCLDAADSNDDGAVDIADAIAVLSHLFGGAGPLPDPFGACGVDQTVDELKCASYSPCE